VAEGERVCVQRSWIGSASQYGRNVDVGEFWGQAEAKCGGWRWSTATCTACGVVPLSRPECMGCMMCQERILLED